MVCGGGVGILASKGAVAHTGDVLVEYVIFFEDVVDDFLGSFVDHQDHPLLKRSSQSLQPCFLIVGRRESLRRSP